MKLNVRYTAYKEKEIEVPDNFEEVFVEEHLIDKILEELSAEDDAIDIYSLCGEDFCIYC